MDSQCKLFISHAEKDSSIVDLFVDLLCTMGLNQQNIIYTSKPEFGIPLKEDIYDFLRNELQSDKIIPIFMLSQNYYKSAACLNEMGAVWVKQYDYYTILLPGFAFENIKGAVNPRKLSMHLGNEISEVRGQLNKFKDEICNLFCLDLNTNLWERQRDLFLSQIASIDPAIYIDMRNSDGFCIGAYELDAAVVHYDRNLKETVGEFDFSKTQADLCSMVFYLDCLNSREKVMNNKTLEFSLKSHGIQNLFVELQIGKDNARQTVRFPIAVETEWQKYQIPLTDFGSTLSKWECCNELNFVIYRKNVENNIGIIKVKDILFE